MNYTESVEYIHSLLQFGIKPGLERISMLLSALGNPHEKIKTVHVAGTNGKGSTSTHLANILSEAGYKTGLYTSPYVLSFCERIQIDGQIISENSLARAITRVREKIEKLNEKGIVITEFEAITAAAFLCFFESGCDYAVVEVGLGGRFDATNVLTKPEASVITSISLDHTKILGDTLAQIAFEKCGIIKNTVPVITSENQKSEVLSVIEKTAKERNCGLLITNPKNSNIVSDKLGETVFEYNGESYTLHLNGEHQIENAVNAIETAKLLGISEEHIKSGLSKTRMLARMEIIGTAPLIIRDGGHNEGCAGALRDFLLRYNIKNIKMLVGLMADKDTEKYLELLCPLCDSVTACTPSNPRAESADNLILTAKKYCNNSLAVSNPKEAYRQVLNSASKDDTVLVCGSFYLMSDIF
ncbi:MAG: bifunctional folylpolyglutamate synthase/dihydrofolate synthase [Oscillospiraceae bacterium]|nr:bifunctional folylpolyglutamate synthase/dihydrofolate synthase [Oscillospiraceae bacterium]